MIRPIPTLLVALALVSTAIPATDVRAEDGPDVERIVRETNHVVYYQGDDGRARVTMTIRDAKGRERVKEFTILRRDVGGGDEDQRFYVYFHAPSDERGTSLMVWKHLTKDDDRWLYLPSLDLVRRIAATDKRTSFVGSDFLYEDISGRALDEDGIAAPLLNKQLMISKLLLHPLQVGVWLIHLVDGNHNGHTGGARVGDGL